jgi:hypothetical protein
VPALPLAAAADVTLLVLVLDAIWQIAVLPLVICSCSRRSSCSAQPLKAELACQPIELLQAIHKQRSNWDQAELASCCSSWWQRCSK